MQSSSGNSALPDALADIKWVNDHEFVSSSPEVEEKDVKAEFRRTVLRYCSDEKFHRAFVRSFGWVGKRYDLSSLAIPEDDEAFRDACDVLYERLSDSFLAPFIDRFADKDLQDVLVIMLGFGPPLWGAVQEISDRKNGGEVLDLEPVKDGDVSTEGKDND